MQHVNFDLESFSLCCVVAVLGDKLLQYLYRLIVTLVCFEISSYLF